MSQSRWFTVQRFFVCQRFILGWQSSHHLSLSSHLAVKVWARSWRSYLRPLKMVNKCRLQCQCYACISKIKCVLIIIYLIIHVFFILLVSNNSNFVQNRKSRRILTKRYKSFFDRMLSASVQAGCFPVPEIWLKFLKLGCKFWIY